MKDRSFSFKVLIVCAVAGLALGACVTLAAIFTLSSMDSEQDSASASSGQDIVSEAVPVGDTTTVSHTYEVEG